MNSLPKIPADESLEISSEGLNYILSNFSPECPERNFVWTTDYKVELPVRVKKSGPGSEKPYTFCEMWKRAVKAFPNNGAINFEASPDKWVTWNYQKYYDQCCTFAKALISLGVDNNATINIIGFNSAYWAVAFSGSIFGNYIPIGIYTTNGPDACAYIANHSECQVVVLEDRSHLQKYISVKSQVSGIKYFILWKDTVPENLDSDFISKVFTWEQFMEMGKKQYNPTKQDDKLETRMTMSKPGNCCTFIYTSGTTGQPKAVMISHDNYTWITDSVSKRFNFDNPEKIGKGRMVSMLPLSHVAAQLVDLVVAIRNGVSIFFTDPSALQGNLVKFLLIAKPTFFVCVPRVWQKIQEKITAVGASTTGMKKTIANWAKGKAADGTYAEQTGKSLPHMWGLSKKLVFDKIKQSLGLDECEYFLFSAAPMRESTRLFFINLNIFLVNCYGMSELAGPQTFTDPLCWENYTSIEFLKESGKCLPGLELAIDSPDSDGNGQICLRGRNCFMGYFKNEAETKATIDKKGFVHSGDVGLIDKHGCLSITGRIKELLITAGGENVAPVLIENQINTYLPIFSHVIVIGDKRKYLTALLSLRLKDESNLADEVVEYFSQRGSSVKTVSAAMNDEGVKKIIDEGIQQVNQKAISKAQRIVKYKILPCELTVDSGMLTPTLKMRRKIINEVFKTEIESLYLDPKL